MKGQRALSKIESASDTRRLYFQIEFFEGTVKNVCT